MKKSKQQEPPETAAPPRRKLDTFTTLAHVVEALSTSKRILVVTGAGISVNCGIPDFRSKDSGLYHTLDCAAIGIPSAELLFDYEYFVVDPEPFYRFARSLLPREDIRPSYCHEFISMLETRKKLLRNYTQNVDGIERKAGVTRVVECHGSISTFRCMHCKKKRTLSLEQTLFDCVTAGIITYETHTLLSIPLIHLSTLFYSLLPS